jgi:hypothetical protein
MNVIFAGIVTTASEPDAARVLFKFLTSPAAAAVIKAAGMEPGGSWGSPFDLEKAQVLAYDDRFGSNKHQGAARDLDGTALAGSPADFGKLIADETEK